MEEHYEIIEGYLDRSLSPEVQKAFETRLVTDADFAREVKLFAAMRRGIAQRLQDEEKDQRLENELRAIGSVYFPPPVKKSFQMTPRMWLMVAGIALVGMVGAWFVLSQLNKDLYTAYAQMPPAAFTTKGANPSEQQLPAAEAAFNKGQYNAALPLLDAYLIDRPNDTEIIFYRALCQLQLGQLTAAQSAFESISRGTTAFNLDALWFLALTYLRQKDKAACRDVLERIPPESSYYAKAQELLGELLNR